jgi:hypothetical protein
MNGSGYDNEERERQRETENLERFGALAIFGLMGLVFVAVGIYLLMDAYAFKARAVTTEAVIIASNGASHTEIEYSVDGETRKAVLSEYVAGRQPGDRLTIYYDPAQPSEVETGLGMFVPWATIAISIVFIVGLVRVVFKH